MRSFCCVLVASLFLIVPPGRAQTHFTSCISNTGSNATIIVDVNGGSHDFAGEPFSAGDEIAFYSEDGTCVGTRVWTGANLALTLWGDNPVTAEKDGLYPGETIELRVWRASSGIEFGGSVGIVDLGYIETPPFIPGGAYYPDGLYNLNSTSITEATREGKNRVKTTRAKSDARERGKDRTGAFRIAREGSVEEALMVFYTISGTAENGVDYAPVDTFATILPGNTAVFVVVDPTPDSDPEDRETVSIVIQDHPDYEIAEPERSASLTIIDGDPVSVEGTAVMTPAAAAHPNPFIDEISITFVAAATGLVAVELFDTLGRRTGILQRTWSAAGAQDEIRLDAGSLAAGMYFVRVVDAGGTRTIAAVKSE